MGSNRFTQLHVYIIGAVVAVIVGAGMYFGLLKPVYADVQTRQGEVQTAEGQSIQVGATPLSYRVEDRDAVLKKGKAAVKQAKAESAATLRTLKILEDRKQLPGSGRIDLGDGSDQYLLRRTMANWLNLPSVVVPRMKAFAMQLGARHNVTVRTSFAAPAPAPVPGQIPRDIIAWNLGGMEVQGNFNNVMQWARDWTSAPLLVAVDGLQCSLAGPTGRVTATSTLTVYIFPTGKAVQIPGAAGAPVAGTMMGSPMGMMGGGVDMGGAAPGGAAMNGPGGAPGVAPP